MRRRALVEREWCNRRTEYDGRDTSGHVTNTVGGDDCSSSRGDGEDCAVVGEEVVGKGP